jgi:CspA family cold shock protein
MCKWWREDKGYGVIATDRTAPWDVWCHFSAIDVEGYRNLSSGESVVVEYVRANQQSFKYLARWVRPLRKQGYRLEVLWDHDAFPVWGEDGSFDPIEVEIGDELRRDLMQWADEWTRIVWGEYGPDDPRTPEPSAEQYREFWSKGRTLADRLQVELGDGFEVVFAHDPPAEGPLVPPPGQ